MSHLSSYLTFNGNCREAMSFYQQCLGGVLQLQTIGDSPLAEKMPLAMSGCILHGTLTKGSFSLMGTDMVADEGLIHGNAVSMLLHCNSEEEVRTCYENLVQGGKETHPLEDSFWGALFGDLTDKYGNCWLLMYDRNQQ